VYKQSISLLRLKKYLSVVIEARGDLILIFNKVLAVSFPLNSDAISDKRITIGYFSGSCIRNNKMPGASFVPECYK